MVEPDRSQPKTTWRPRASRRPQRLAAPLLLALLLGVLAACSGTPHPSAPEVGQVERGVASWYGGRFHGRATASGERYDMHRLTAAHRELPFGTLVEVVNLDNGRSVQVEITDRGPFVHSRILDLSFAAAEQLDMIGPGTARVRLKVLAAAATVPAAPPSTYLVQAGAFRDSERADALYRELSNSYGQAKVEYDGLWHRVQIGPFDSLKKAEKVARDLGRDGISAIVKAAG